MANDTAKLVEQARTERNSGKFQEAFDLYQKALEAIQGSNTIENANLNTEIGLFLDELREAKLAIQFHTAALELIKASDNPNDIADINYNLCVSYINDDNPEKAEEHAQEAYKSYQKQKNVEGETDSLYALGLTYNLKKDYEKALDFLTQALKSYRKSKQVEGITSVLLDLGNVYIELENYEKAIKQYKAAEKYSIELDDKGGIGDALTCIGKVYEEKEDMPRCYTYYVNAAEFYIQVELFDLAKENLDIVEPNIMSLPKATRKRLRNKIWDLKALLPKKIEKPVDKDKKEEVEEN